MQGDQAANNSNTKALFLGLRSVKAQKKNLKKGRRSPSYKPM